MTLNQQKNTIKEQFIVLLRDVADFHLLNREEQTEQASLILEKVFESTNIYLSEEEKKDVLSELLEDVVFGLRRIQKFQDDPEIEEIMINGYRNVYIKKRLNDKFVKTSVHFKNDDELNKIIEKLLEGTGRRVDRSNPLVDLRLPDGSRANIVVSPLSLIGPCITIRKFPEETITPEDLLKTGVMDKQSHLFLKKAVENKLNILIAGGTAAGKTTTLTALTNYIHQDKQKQTDRVVVIEQTAEIKLPKELDNSIQLECRLNNNQGVGSYTIRDLLKNALRMRPDRIIVGEVRGGEAFDMLQAMNSGHPGSFSTIHANNAADALSRLEALVLLAGFDQLVLETIKKWIANSLDVVLFMKKCEDGKRRLVEIAGVSSNLELDPIMTYKNGEFVTNKDNIKKYQEINRN